MPSVFSHAVAGLSLGACVLPAGTPRFVLALGAACAVLPDLDVTGLAIGFGLDHPFGHRGFSHSILCAGLVATGLVAAVRLYRPAVAGAMRLWWYFFVSTLSHGLLDAMTNGGRGVAFFAPVSERRYHFAFRPIEVSPIGVREFFTDRGAAIMANELVWIWLPCLLAAGAALWLRRRSVHSSSWSARHS